jgi:hypothetical protein
MNVAMVKLPSASKKKRNLRSDDDGMIFSVLDAGTGCSLITSATIFEAKYTSI